MIHCARSAPTAAYSTPFLQGILASLFNTLTHMGLCYTILACGSPLLDFRQGVVLPNI